VAVAWFAPTACKRLGSIRSFQREASYGGLWHFDGAFGSHLGS
jgi:hypothetical protein